MQPQQILQNRYQLQHLLGDNLNRQTWLAEDLQQKELVVLKCLILGQASSNQWQHLKLFEREAQVLQQLDHTFIPQYRDYFAIDDRTLWFALVEEYIPGNSLAELLQQGKKFTEEQVRGIAIAILEILIYLHELNPPVLHRDIKPSNLVWHESSKAENPEIFLVDFGAVQDKASAEGKTITVVGTYGYAPMEQFGGRAVAASDLYALGATLIHLLTGIPPADLPQDDMRIEFKERTSASQKLVQWIEILTEPNVKRRPQTASEALELLLSNKLINDGFLPNLKTSQPPFSKIKLKSTSENLRIIIPNGNFATSSGRGLSLIWNILLLILLATPFYFSITPSLSILMSVINSFPILILFPVFLVFNIVVGIVILNLCQGILYRIIGYQLVSFNKNVFTFQECIFNQTLKITKGNIDEIRNVIHSIRVNPNEEEYDMVMIQTLRKRYTFGYELTLEECMWLVQEIKQWLNMP